MDDFPVYPDMREESPGIVQEYAPFVFGGVMLIVGWQARWAALALAAFTLVASVLFHNFWAMPADKAFTTADSVRLGA